MIFCTSVIPQRFVALYDGAGGTVLTNISCAKAESEVRGSKLLRGRQGTWDVGVD